MDFFYDKKDNIRQGYLIYDPQKEKSIINMILKILKENKNPKFPYISKAPSPNFELFLKCNNKNYKKIDINISKNNNVLRESYRKYKKDINVHNNNKIEKKINKKNKEKNDIIPDTNVTKKNDFRNKKKINKRSCSAHMRIFKVEKKLIEKNNLNLEEFLPKAVHKKSTPGVIGLSNIGATCYINATLQCFSNIKGLRWNLLKKDIYKTLEKNKNLLSFALANVLKNLWENNNIKFYAPEYFKKIISEKNQLFKGIAANDPKDLIIFLLETMHKELNKPKNMNLINNNINNTNFIEVFNEFSNYYISKNNSIISNEFYGFNNSMITCGFC